MTLDLRQQMHEATADLSPSGDLVTRAQREGRRRLRLRRQWTIGGSLATLALVGLSVAYLTLGQTQYREAIAHSATPTMAASTAAPPAAVLQAVTEAKTEGTLTGPVEWVLTTSHRVASLSHDGPGTADVPIYAVHMSGEFVLNSAPRPAGAKSPRGTEMVVFVPVTSSDQGGGGLLLNDQPVDLSPYGEVHTFQP
jgi:hypothetical protein